MIYNNKGIVVRLFYLVVALAVWGLTIGGRLFLSKKIILCYHDITAENVNDFYRQMQLVANRVIALNTLCADNQKITSQPAVVITFDDAFENLLTNAMPVINELSIPISIYVVTGFMGGKPEWLKGSNHGDEHKKLMSSYQIKNLTENSLVSFGIHTHTHPKLTSIENTTMNYEFRKSKELLENVIGQNVCSLAYPHGAYNAEVTATAESCGLTQLLTLEEQMVHSSQIEGEMGRFLMDPDVWFLEFKLTVDGAYSWLFSFRRNVRLLKKYVGA